MSLLNFEYPSLESIDYQRKSLLFKELTAAFEELETFRMVSQRDLSSIGLVDIIKRHTGVTIIPLIDMKSKYNAHIKLPNFSLNNPIDRRYPEALRKCIHQLDVKAKVTTDLAKDGVLGRELAGIVDLENSRISGDLSDFRCELHYGYGLISARAHNTFSKHRLTPAELAAMTLHELGHVFTYFEWLLRTATTNLYLDYAWKNFSGTQDKQLRMLIVDKTVNYIGGAVDKESLIDTNSEDYFYTVFLLSSFEQIRSSLGTADSDYRLSEQAADQFAARHGAARDVITGLMKIQTRGFEHISTYYNGKTYVLLTIMETAHFLMSLTRSPANMMRPLGLFFGLFSPKHGRQIYDRPKIRIEKMLLEIASYLKNQDLSAEERNSLLSDYQFTKSILEKISDREDLYTVIWTNLTSYRRDQRMQLKFQQELERLANNELFVKASNFKSLL